jgi:hypothetical protein
MGLFERLFLGEVLGEWELEREGLGIGVATVSLVLARRRGKFKIAIRTKHASLLGFSVHYTRLPIDCLPQLRDAIHEACLLGDSMPPSAPV